MHLEMQSSLGDGDQEENVCAACGKKYKQKRALFRHVKFECGIQARFKCPYCDARSKQRTNTYRHVRMCHPGLEVGFVEIL